MNWLVPVSLVVLILAMGAFALALIRVINQSRQLLDERRALDELNQLSKQSGLPGGSAFGDVESIHKNLVDGIQKNMMLVPSNLNKQLMKNVSFASGFLSSDAMRGNPVGLPAGFVLGTQVELAEAIKRAQAVGVGGIGVVGVGVGVGRIEGAPQGTPGIEGAIAPTRKPEAA